MKLNAMQASSCQLTIGRSAMESWASLLCMLGSNEPVVVLHIFIRGYSGGMLSRRRQT
jgi:hypothetical protein